MKRKRLGELLIEKRLITEPQLIEALEYQKKHQMRLGESLVELGFIHEDALLDMLSAQLGIPLIRKVSSVSYDQKIVSQVPLHIMKANKFIPLSFDKHKGLTVLCNDSHNGSIPEVCEKTFKISPHFILAKNSLILTLIDEYARDKERAESLERIRSGSITMTAVYDLNVTDDSDTVREVNHILLEAFRMRASDIHLTQEETIAKLKYRIDGVLELVRTYPARISGALVSRMKNMSGVISTEKRRPQDGGFQAVAEGITFDMRLSSNPVIYGENVVIRILDHRYIDTLTLDGLGFSDHNKARYLSLLKNPNGILAVTGPTGSGKTSTNYVSLKHLNTGKKAIYSIEDPVEYKLSGIVSTQINEKTGVTFATALRTLVRQDPDIIYIGEIRDGDTAQMAVNASNTGQFILTTLHTNDSVSAISRLLNLGAKPYQLIDAFLGATAQVLVRKVCDNCQGKGCTACNNGFYGRVPLQEVMIFSDNMKDALLSASTPNVSLLRKIALQEGLIPMIEDGYEKIKQGITTESEVLNAVRYSNHGAGR